MYDANTSESKEMLDEETFMRDFLIMNKCFPVTGGILPR